MREISNIELYSAGTGGSSNYSISYSSRLSNDFLAMTLADFDSVSKGERLSFIDEDTYAMCTTTNEKVFDSMIVYQLSDNNPSPIRKYYTSVSSSEMCTMRIPEGVTEIRITHNDGTSRVMDVSSNSSDERMFILIDSSTPLDNISPMIHEASKNPHVFLGKEILMRDKFTCLRRADLVKNMVDTRNDIKLGFSSAGQVQLNY
jgi:hypothetical protein